MCCCYNKLSVSVPRCTSRSNRAGLLRKHTSGLSVISPGGPYVSTLALRQQSDFMLRALLTRGLCAPVKMKCVVGTLPFAIFGSGLYERSCSTDSSGFPALPYHLAQACFCQVSLLGAASCGLSANSDPWVKANCTSISSFLFFPNGG